MTDRFEFETEEVNSQEELHERMVTACDTMESIYQNGEYPKLLIKRSWSKHNPIITGEMAKPKAFRWYLLRELKKLGEKGAVIKIIPSRERLPLNDPDLLDNTDEDDWDITQKKLFLFSPGTHRNFS
ncbi:MAG: hypothetical protein U5J63_18450 [Fodinibius sp.]|nr:hypothetical protein [Fodinibius sp.]